MWLWTYSNRGRTGYAKNCITFEFTSRVSLLVNIDVLKRLQIIPERIFVERTIRPKYACKACEGSGDEDNPAVRVAPAPVRLIPGSIATENVLSHIFVSKFVDHLPYYRQESRFNRIGVSISRQNMSNWQL